MSAQTKNTKVLVFFIDQQKFETTTESFSVRELLVMAGENPDETTLVIRHGNDLTRLTDLDAHIEIKNGLHFVIFHNGPTPVS